MVVALPRASGGDRSASQGYPTFFHDEFGVRVIVERAVVRRVVEGWGGEGNSEAQRA